MVGFSESRDKHRVTQFRQTETPLRRRVRTAMAVLLRGLLLLLIPLALADTELPCEGYEVVEGFVLKDLELPSQIGVKVLENDRDVVDEQACWARCCNTDGCDMAVMSAGTCNLVRCVLKGFDVCELTAQEGARTYRKVNAGVPPVQEGNDWGELPLVTVHIVRSGLRHWLVRSCHPMGRSSFMPHPLH